MDDVNIDQAVELAQFSLFFNQMCDYFSFKKLLVYCSLINYSKLVIYRDNAVVLDLVHLYMNVYMMSL